MLLMAVILAGHFDNGNQYGWFPRPVRLVLNRISTKRPPPTVNDFRPLDTRNNRWAVAFESFVASSKYNWKPKTGRELIALLYPRSLRSSVVAISNYSRKERSSEYKAKGRTAAHYGEDEKRIRGKRRRKRLFDFRGSNFHFLEISSVEAKSRCVTERTVNECLSREHVYAEPRRRLN